MTPPPLLTTAAAALTLNTHLVCRSVPPRLSHRRQCVCEAMMRFGRMCFLFAGPWLALFRMHARTRVQNACSCMQFMPAGAPSARASCCCRLPSPPRTRPPAGEGLVGVNCEVHLRLLVAVCAIALRMAYPPAVVEVAVPAASSHNIVPEQSVPQLWLHTPNWRCGSRSGQQQASTHAGPKTAGRP